MATSVEPVGLLDRQHEPEALGAPEADVRPSAGGDRQDLRRHLLPMRAPAIRPHPDRRAALLSSRRRMRNGRENSSCRVR